MLSRLRIVSSHNKRLLFKRQTRTLSTKIVNRTFPKEYLVDRSIRAIKFRNLKDDHWSLHSIPIMAQFPYVQKLYFENCSDSFIIQNLMFDNLEHVNEISLHPHHSQKKVSFLSPHVQNHIHHAFYCRDCTVFSGYVPNRTVDLPHTFYYSSYSDYQARWALNTVHQNKLYTLHQARQIMGRSNSTAFLHYINKITNGRERKYYYGNELLLFLTDFTNRSLRVD